jgi:undecaprenyl diphosphate synthase
MHKEPDLSRLPRHIAIIMDGNGRWAKKRGLPRIFGHRAGAKTVPTIVEACSDLGIEVLTMYSFSTENWLRPRGEITGLMSILRTYLKRQLANMLKNNIRLRTIGDISHLPEAVRSDLKNTIKATEKNGGMILNLALNYGGRQEIVQAVNALLKKGLTTIDEKAISEHLFTAGLPDPDLLIRTSGEMRVSNFLLWQIAYTELHITPVLWPDFTPDDLRVAVAVYQKRERRYGAVTERA